jgi:hypothetical protein
MKTTERRKSSSWRRALTISMPFILGIFRSTRRIAGDDGLVFAVGAPQHIQRLHPVDGARRLVRPPSLVKSAFERLRITIIVLNQQDVQWLVRRSSGHTASLRYCCFGQRTISWSSTPGLGWLENARGIHRASRGRNCNSWQEDSERRSPARFGLATDCAAALLDNSQNGGKAHWVNTLASAKTIKWIGRCNIVCVPMARLAPSGSRGPAISPTRSNARRIR